MWVHNASLQSHWLLRNTSGFFFQTLWKGQPVRFLDARYHFFFYLPLNWKDKSTPFLASWYIIRHGMALEDSPLAHLSEMFSPVSAVAKLLVWSQRLQMVLLPKPHLPWGSLLAVLLIMTMNPTPPLPTGSPPHPNSLWPMLSGRGKVGEFQMGGKYTKTILIIFTPVMVKILHAHCNIIINVPMRKEWSAAGAWQIISFQTGKQSTVGRDWSLKRQFGTQSGFHLSDDGGPNGPPRLGLGLGGLLGSSCSLITSQSSWQAWKRGLLSELSQLISCPSSRAPLPQPSEAITVHPQPWAMLLGAWLRRLSCLKIPHVHLKLLFSSGELPPPPRLFSPLLKECWHCLF